MESSDVSLKRLRRVEMACCLLAIGLASSVAHTIWLFNLDYQAHSGITLTHGLVVGESRLSTTSEGAGTVRVASRGGKRAISGMADPNGRAIVTVGSSDEGVVLLSEDDQSPPSFRLKYRGAELFVGFDRENQPMLSGTDATGKAIWRVP